MLKRRERQLSPSKIIAAVVLIGSFLLVVDPSLAQDAKKDTTTDTRVRPTFAEVDAVHLMDGMRHALESNKRGRFLKMFDAKRMPGYAVFRDQVSAFFATYDAFQVRYQVTQAAMDGEFGAALATFELDARPSDGVTPNVRKSVALRLIAAWDGKQWRIVDLAPRTWLQ